MAKKQKNHFFYESTKFKQWGTYIMVSSNIIMVKPAAKPIVPMLLCLPCCDDGISSSTTT